MLNSGIIFNNNNNPAKPPKYDPDTIIIKIQNNNLYFYDISKNKILDLEFNQIINYLINPENIPEIINKYLFKSNPEIIISDYMVNIPFLIQFNNLFIIYYNSNSDININIIKFILIIFSYTINLITKILVNMVDSKIKTSLIIYNLKLNNKIQEIIQNQIKKINLDNKEILNILNKNQESQIRIHKKINKSLKYFLYKKYG